MAFQKNTLDCESGSSLVTLNTFASLGVHSAKGLSRWATRFFAAAQNDKAVIPTILPLLF